jgi:peptidoglycan/LPS O-acetylase OafA/YrhL
LKQPAHRPTLGTYRFTLAGTVFFSHLTPLPFQFLYYSSGYAAVLAFYVVSGYLISNALETFYVGRVRDFMINRCLRIYPGYWVVLALTMMALAIFGTDHIEAFSGGTHLSLRELSQSEVVLSPFNFNLIAVAWSLRVEMTFYLTIAAVYGLLGRGAIYVACCAALGVYLFGAAFLEMHWTNPIAHAPYFVIGIALSRLRLGRDSAAAALWLIGGASILALVAFAHRGVNGLHEHLLAPVIFEWSGSYSVWWPVGLVIMFVGCLMVNGSGWLRDVDKFLGDLSYPLFLCHYSVNTIIGFVLASWPERQVMWVAIAATCVATLLLYWFVDRPITKPRDRVRGFDLYSLAGAKAPPELTASSQAA